MKLILFSVLALTLWGCSWGAKREALEKPNGKVGSQQEGSKEDQGAAETKESRPTPSPTKQRPTSESTSPRPGPGLPEAFARPKPERSLEEHGTPEKRKEVKTQKQRVAPQLKGRKPQVRVQGQKKTGQLPSQPKKETKKPNWGFPRKGIAIKKGQATQKETTKRSHEAAAARKKKEEKAVFSKQVLPRTNVAVPQEVASSKGEGKRKKQEDNGAKKLGRKKPFKGERQQKAAPKEAVRQPVQTRNATEPEKGKRGRRKESGRDRDGPTLAPKKEDAPVPNVPLVFGPSVVGESQPGGQVPMPSLPTTCLLSESAIACGNVKMKFIPVLADAGLKTLYLAENEIAKIPADAFSGLPNLEWLDLSKNKLDSQGLHPDAFKNLAKLKRLNLDGNSLATIPSLPSSLQELKLNDNDLQGLLRQSFRGLFKLLTLEVEGNHLHDGNIYPLTFKPLRSLIYLRLDRNRLRAIPSGLPPSLQELHLDTNHIEEVTEGVLNKTLNLSVLVLSNNRLQEDRIAPRAWIDLPKLESLDLSYNRLVHVPSFLPRGLKQLTLHHNRIERIPGYVFAHMKPGLEFLHLSHNNLRDDGIHGVSFLGLHWSLAELLLDNNEFRAIPRGILNLKSLQVLRLSHNKIRHVPLNSICDTRVAEDSNLISMHLENNLIDRRRIPPTAFSCIKAYHSVVLRPQQNEEDY
ncbi:extracellular matrix protein 2 [Ornithorhynchus anatinus]|uniref:extracellular matrix protein 2 n=1 Tax=Ornithorhynchus anatinus TaxID=9258 RepID=UPI0019D45231|nr:extracellular matrix protein 2 [Ornithorhynchus anatinus]